MRENDARASTHEGMCLHECYGSGLRGRWHRGHSKTCNRVPQTGMTYGLDRSRTCGVGPVQTFEWTQGSGSELEFKVGVRVRVRVLVRDRVRVQGQGSRACTMLPLPSTSSESGRLRLTLVASSSTPRMNRFVEP